MKLPPAVILASGSIYRRELLQRLLAVFECLVPNVDESALPDETPATMALRLAGAKAARIARDRPAAIVIGSDQVPSLDGQLLRKPGDRDGALRQLTKCSGRTVVFHTAVAVQGPDQAAERFVDETVVRFRQLGTDVIQRYIDAEQPYDCAGSFKVEGLGIALFESIDTCDPTALQGLPLIWLAACLNRLGLAVP